MLQKFFDNCVGVVGKSQDFVRDHPCLISRYLKEEEEFTSATILPIKSRFCIRHIDALNKRTPVMIRRGRL